MSGTQGPGGGSARGRVAQMRAAQQKRERRSRVLLVSVVAGIVVLIVGVTGFTIYQDVSSRPTLDAVRSFEVASGHTTEPVTYAQTPPTGGAHNPVWLNCGVYDAPVRNELAVHALEHGAVWVTYSSDVPVEQVASLRERIPDTYMVLSPFDGLPAPVVVSAWGTQLELSGANDPRLEEFITAYRQGPQTPEPGAACTGGSDGELLAP